MSAKKDFDCVEMKREIQRRILESYAGRPAAETRRLQWEEIQRDPILGPYLARVTRTVHPTRS